MPTAEILKRRVAGLHQLVATSTVALTDVWEPTVEGLERIETTRYASAIEITLSKVDHGDFLGAAIAWVETGP